MSLVIFLVLIVVVVLPVAWLVSEFITNRRSIRCTLGILAILSCFGVAWSTAQLVRINYNTWYGSAAKELLDATIQALESEDNETVLQELKIMREQFHPTYESRSHFDELAEKAAKRIKADCSTNKALPRTLTNEAGSLKR